MTDQQMIVPLDQAGVTLADVGGKGLNLTRLVRAGFPVPPGFIVTTAGYDRFVGRDDLTGWIERMLEGMRLDDPDALAALSDQIRHHFEARPLPAPLVGTITTAYRQIGAPPVAVRSSATAEDLPELSFAGQQDTFLNVVGENALLDAVRRCWSSLWTARAIGYRHRSGIPQGGLSLAVVVQQMIESEASGLLFTANPLTGRRAEHVIDATLGLGEALVAGQVEPDHFVVDLNGPRIVERRLGAKALAIHARAGGGTVTTAVGAADRPALPDDAILALSRVGSQVEAALDGPQDIEWAWAAQRLYLLQARPITALYPLPKGMRDGLRLLLSFGAVQGVQLPITPLGRDTIRSLFAGAARLFGYQSSVSRQRLLLEAGERLWADITPLAAHPVGGRIAARISPVIEASLGPTIALLQAEGPATGRRPSFETGRRIGGFLAIALPVLLRGMLRPVPARRRSEDLMASLVARARDEMDEVQDLAGWLARYDALTQHLFNTLIGKMMPMITAGILPMLLIDRLLPGEVAPSLLLTRGLPHNVTTEMDLALWAAATTIRADAESAAVVTSTPAVALTAAWRAGSLPPVAQTALARFLERYGDRGLAEIDLGRPRWRDDPTQLLETIRSYLQIEDERLAPDTVFARGAAEAERTIDRLTARAHHGPLGPLRARLVRALARRVRTLAGLRESPKFTIIRAFGAIRAALLRVAVPYVESGIIEQSEDLFFLTLEELRMLARGESTPLGPRIAARRERAAFESRRRQIPRILLSDGRAIHEGVGAVGSEEGVLVGTPVSPGVAEGVVRVVFNPGEARLEPGNILVCPGTDPAWTPLFLAAGALVMEVGGLMTHGSVVAREYGIPAVVGVHDATRRLEDGQRVRVDGSSGRIQILDDAPATFPEE